MTVFPVLVQGEAAASDIAGMIDWINANYDDIDTLIVGRGGGSMEDLWAFNEEIVARAIYRSRIPVISAVGHEIDFTIADFAADRRAETPTAAAEMAVPSDAELAERLNTLKDSLLVHLENRVSSRKLRLEQYRQELDVLLERRVADETYRLERLRLILEENRPEKILDKGYAMMETEDGHVITSVSGLEEGTRYRLRMKDGSVIFTMDGIAKEGGTHGL